MHVVHPVSVPLCGQLRITAAQALKHPFIAHSYETTPEGAWSKSAPPADEDIRILLARIRSFADAPPLRRLAVLAAAHLLGPQDDPTVRAKYLAFRTTDQSGDGVITAEEIRQVIHKFGSQVEVPADLEEMLQRIERLTGRPNHPFLRRGLFFSHRDLE